MANEEHLAILRQGVDVWNAWRQDHPNIEMDLRDADLRDADLRGARLHRAKLTGAKLQEASLSGAKLTGASLTGADLTGARLQDAFLTGADLQDAKLTGARLRGADLQDAKLTGARLRGADLTRAKLTGANLTGADLQDASLTGANLTGADLQDASLQDADLRGASLYRVKLPGANMKAASIGWTVFADVDLRAVQSLAHVVHTGPSTIGIDTLYLSGGDIPEVFLRGCGVPDSMIEYARALVLAERPIDYYSCFISYSNYDAALAKRLHADLQARGVRCWYAPHDLKIGESILGGIEQGIRLHDKLLLLLSESSVNSAWVDAEVQMALVRERAERRRVLFPVRIDDAVLTSGAAWAVLVRGDYHIGDFRQWKEHDAYQESLKRLLRDLKAEKGG
jgi:uncharacterized protein YjbI with pentapeptide repeats